MGFFQQLKTATEEDRAGLLAIPVLQDGAQGRISLPTYRAFLAEAYHHVKHTVPLLMACGARLPERHEWLREAVGEYIQEESGHHEWILNDIHACGGDAEAVRAGQPASATDVMVAYAWDTVQRRNPVGFFGMVLVLEGTSVALASQAAERLRETLDLPESATTYLSSHGALDIDHIAYFERLMDRLEEPADQAAVTHCARMMYRLYGDVFRSLPHPAP
ncbi:MAG TPA: iron-containing redox enzyme family protein [Gammaproteobacteria bacterium]|nr:iron-containing redox enzyme family protein [Gammaproteobacteria bacterium]